MLVLDKEGVDYLASIGFQRSLLANTPNENRIFIKPSGKHPYCINMEWNTPVGGTYEEKNNIWFGKPAIGIFYQTLDNSMHRVRSEIPLFLGTLHTLSELKVLLKQLGIK